MATSNARGGQKRASAKTWKRNKGTDLELPSGNVALVKRPGMDKFLSAGIMPDSLTPIVVEAVQSGKGLPPEKTQELMKDSNINELFVALDRCLVYCVVEPDVMWHRRETGEKDADGKPILEDIPEDERDTDTYVYTDEVDVEDKMFIFNFAVGGSRDLESFRKELSDGVGSVQPG